MGRYDKLFAASKQLDAQPTVEPSGGSKVQTPKPPDENTISRTSAHPHIRTNVQSSVQSDVDALVQTVRQIVKLTNNRSGNHSFSDAEKDALDDMVMSLKRQGYRRTSGNELIRIFVALGIQSYEQLGEDSPACKVIQSLYDWCGRLGIRITENMRATLGACFFVRTNIHLHNISVEKQESHCTYISCLLGWG